MPKPNDPNPGRRVEVFPVKGGGGWMWRRVATRGNLSDLVVADSGESYSTQADARDAAFRENPDYVVVSLSE